MAESTIGQYNSHLRKFQEFCENRNHMIFPIINVELGIEFLSNMFDNQRSYSTINSARSAISQFSTLTNGSGDFGNHPLTMRFMKGVFRLRPPCPKYEATWDVAPVLRYLEGMDMQNLKTLSLKCSLILALVTGQRVQTLAALDINFMTILDDKIVFNVQKCLKTSKPGKALSVEIHKYTNSRPLICPYTCLQNYLRVTSTLRKGNSLFISFIKPHKAIGSQTISRWISLTLGEAGVSPSFGAHSVRHASSSKAAIMKVPVDRILSTVGWAN